MSKDTLSGIMGLLCPEPNVGNIKKCTFRNSGAPVRRTRRRKSQNMHFQEFWDSCAQNRTSEISNIALSRILGLLCAEQDVTNLKKIHFQEFRVSCAQNRTSEISKNALSGILGLLCAGQNVGNLKKMHFQEFWYSCAQNKTSHYFEIVEYRCEFFSSLVSVFCEVAVQWCSRGCELLVHKMHALY